MEREYSPIPERALRALEGFPTAYRQDIEDDVARFRHVTPRAPDSDGAVEVLHGVEITHRFVQALARARRSPGTTFRQVRAGQLSCSMASPIPGICGIIRARHLPRLTAPSLWT
jgi:hypothetical protein